MDACDGRPLRLWRNLDEPQPHARDHPAAIPSEEERRWVLDALHAFIDALRASLPVSELQAAIAASDPPSATKPEDRVVAPIVPPKAVELLEAWGHNAGDALRAGLGAALSALAVASFQKALQAWAAVLGALPRWTPEDLAPVRGWALRRADSLSSQISRLIVARVVKMLEQGISSAANLGSLLEEIQGGSAAIWFTEAQLAAMADDAAYVAAQHGRHDAHRQLGATRKVWSIVDDTRTCPICLANSAQGGIPMDRDFQSGDPHPPAHPHCRCSLDYLGITRVTAMHVFGIQ